MKKLLFAVGGVVWLVAVFLIVFRTTFPSDALIERARVAVDEASGGAFRLDVEGVSPAWIGLRASNVILSSVADGVATPTLAVEDVKVTTGLLSALGGSPRVVGWARFGDGRIAFDGVIGQDEDGAYGLSAIDLDASSFPITALPPIQGTKLQGTGGFDLAVDVDATEGFKKAEGEARLSGRGIEITGLSGGFGPIAEGFGIVPASIDELDLELDIVSGRALVSRGVVDASLAAVEISGDVVLQDVLSRSRLRLDVVIDAREGLSSVASAMRSAEWSDGKYHYELRGTLGRPRFSAAREGRARRSRPSPEPARRATRDPDTQEERQRAVERRRPGRPGRGDDDPTLEAARQAREALRSGGAPGVPSGIERLRDNPRLMARDEGDVDDDTGGGEDTAEPGGDDE